MPATAARPHPVDLWLCGHHYRASQAALAEAGAAVQTLGHDGGRLADHRGRAASGRLKRPEPGSSPPARL